MKLGTAIRNGRSFFCCASGQTRSSENITVKIDKRQPKYTIMLIDEIPGQIRSESHHRPLFTIS